MTTHLLAGDGYWLKINPATGRVSALARAAKNATIFPDAKAAKAALARALACEAKEFKACFAPGAAPSINISGFEGAANAGAMDRQSPKALKIAIRFDQIKSCADEAFEPPSRVSPHANGLPSLFAVISADGRFVRKGSTGYTTFVELPSEATFFHTAKAAQTYVTDCSPSKDALPLMAAARVAELRLALGASLDPASLAPSENHATLALRSRAERAELAELPAPARKARKSPSI